MKKILTLATLLVVLTAQAQQDPQFTQFFYNRLWVNPGYAGSSDAICANLLGRSQWLGFEGHPTTVVFSADMPIQSINSGVGLNFMQDRIGVINTTAVKATYAYRLPLGPGKLGLGVDIGFMNRRVGTGLIPLQQNDPTLSFNNVPASSGVVDFSFGAYYNTDKIWFGLSATHLQGNRFDFSGVTTLQNARHLWIMGGYNWAVNQDFEIRPSIMVKTDLAAAQFDLNVTAVYQNKFWGGISYRAVDAVAVNLGLNIWKDLRLGLAYDITTSQIGNFSSGSPEVFLGYCYKLIKPAVIRRSFNGRNLSDR